MNLEKMVTTTISRTGAADGTTDKGRYWLLFEPVILKEMGNGWDSAKEEFSLHIRHFEDGEVQAVVEREVDWRRNNIFSTKFYSLNALLKCESTEDVVVILKKGIKTGEFLRDDFGNETGVPFILDCYSDYFSTKLAQTLAASLGMPQSRPGPDEAPEK